MGPPLTDNWDLEFFCPCYNVDGSLRFKISLDTYVNPVWNATATFTLDSNNASCKRICYDFALMFT